MSNFKLQTSHPLIQSEQTFVLDRKVISVHSIDRDYKKWPNSNSFGIDLGEAFHNVQSLRLIDYSVPLNNYTFSESYQNTKMSFTYTTKLRFNLGDANSTPVFNNVSGNALPSNKSIIDAIMFQLIPATTTGTWVKEIPEYIGIYIKQTDGSWKKVNENTTLASDNVPTPPFTNMDSSDMQLEIRWEPPDFQVTVPEGSYTAENLAKTVESLMNKEDYDKFAKESS